MRIGHLKDESHPYYFSAVKYSYFTPVNYKGMSLLPHSDRTWNGSQKMHWEVIMLYDVASLKALAIWHLMKCQIPSVRAHCDTFCLLCSSLKLEIRYASNSKSYMLHNGYFLINHRGKHVHSASKANDFWCSVSYP